MTRILNVSKGVIELTEREAQIYERGRIDALEELKSKTPEIIRWLIKRDKEGYGTTNGELLDHIWDIAIKLEEQINE